MDTYQFWWSVHQGKGERWRDSHITTQWLIACVSCSRCCPVSAEWSLVKIPAANHWKAENQAYNFHKPNKYLNPLDTHTHLSLMQKDQALIWKWMVLPMSIFMKMLKDLGFIPMGVKTNFQNLPQKLLQNGIVVLQSALLLEGKLQKLFQKKKLNANDFKTNPCIMFRIINYPPSCNGYYWIA